MATTNKSEVIDRLKRKIDARPKRINVTIGFKIVEEGKPTWYFAEQTPEGMCYKDLDAYNNGDDICYIPECGFDGEGWGVEYRDGLGYTREEILQIIEDELDWNYPDVPECKEFTQLEADCVFHIVNWETIGVAVERIDFDEEWSCFCIKSDKNIK
jgi:hypothetical protein